MTIPLGVHLPPAHPAPPPARADVVVIGGGIIGVTAALYAARRGLSVALVEKGRVGAEQSGRNWGWIRVQGRDEAEIPLVLEAQRLWAELDAEAQGATGLARHGVMYLANTPKDTARHEAFLTLAGKYDLTTRMLTRSEVDAMFPGHRGDWRSALWTPADQRAEPFQAVPAIARLAERAGATLHEGCAARALDIAGGRITGVITEAGRIACDQVVLAGGAWSSLFLAAHGVGLPQLSVRATVAATEPLPDMFAGNATDSRFAFRRRADGGYTLAPGDFHEFLIGPDSFRHFGQWVRTWAEDPWSTRLVPAAPGGYPDGWTTPRRWGPGARKPVRTAPHARPAAPCGPGGTHPRRLPARVPVAAPGADQGGLGRHDRQPARHRAGDRPCGGDSGPYRGHGDERARLRHRAGRGPRAGRPSSGAARRGTT